MSFWHENITFSANLYHFVTETTLETWFPWQQVKVYPQTFDFETFSIKIGEISQIFKKITFMAPKLLKKNLGGGW